MQTFTEFLIEGDGLSNRNAAIDIPSIVKQVAIDYKSKATEYELKAIADYLLKSKIFSLGKMDDTYGSSTVSTGFLKAVIAAVKDAINSGGWGKKGSSTGTQTQAQRIDSYLKQKHIGPIKR